MELTLADVERITTVSRYQISRYAKDGRLRRTRKGYYDAASLANLFTPFNPLEHVGKDITEEREVWLLRARHEFRRDLEKAIERRHDHRGYGRPQLTAAERREINEAVEAFVATLAARPER